MFGIAIVSAQGSKAHDMTNGWQNIRICMENDENRKQRKNDYEPAME